MVNNYMDDLLEQSLLFDFYGELLTKHQKSIYEDFLLNDLSLSEIADEKGITRQGVHDLVKRCNQTLHNYEDKLHLVERFINAKEKIEKIHGLTTAFKGSRDLELIDEIEKISEELLEEI